MGGLFSVGFKLDWEAKDIGYRENYESTYKSAADIIKKYKGEVCIITGAGISSHILPTFRSNDSKGLWNVVSDKSLDKMHFYNKPDVSWKLWASIRDLQSRNFLYPSKAHRVIHYLLKEGFVNTIITQNIDSLHSFKGDEDKVIEIHGKVTEFGKCIKCGTTEKINHEKILQSGKCPVCSICHENLRPTVAFFQDLIPNEIRQKASDTVRKSKVLILVGTHAAVDPVLSMTMEAIHNGTIVIEVNPDETRISDICDLKFYEKADDAMVGIGTLIFPHVDFDKPTNEEPC